MSRFFITPEASADLNDLRVYLARLPPEPGNRIATHVREALRSIAANPYLGLGQSELTRAFGQEVRSWPVEQYRMGGRYLEVLGVLHTARDHTAILRQCIQ